MTTPRGFRDRSDDSLLTLIGDLPELVRNLVVAELAAAKAWAMKTGKDAGIGGLWMVAALIMLFWSIPALGAFAIIGLSSWWPAWLSALVVFVVMLLIVVVLALLGLLRFRKMSNRSNPGQAIATDAKIVKDAVNEY
ncbi:phage holin family protein [Microbacterium sp. zg.Y1090]|uniref:phage holin family protein n=1 Tax=Microbacterium TaxID=33882 RepID=UPI00214D0736|nr:MULTISPECIES: phage holin family protein [unclassified Microbacterium]MCR2813252.1 phage holin family protein [Microbacterium sp. zg.Y1084]MCR2819565.1 phage holin family protein [Microbacterium sp. zg.Y1090]WIM28532.1 phage holin family protein [Microbacterium sp. zg-Y1090]